MTKEEAIKILMGYSHTPQERAALETLIPELAESEDERIRKAIIELIHRTPSSAFESNAEFGFVGATHNEMLAYLEKQKENSKSSSGAMPNRMRFMNASAIVILLPQSVPSFR